MVVLSRLSGLRRLIVDVESEEYVIMRLDDDNYTKAYRLTHKFVEEEYYFVGFDKGFSFNSMYFKLSS